MSLLQDVLRHQTLDSIERRFDTTQPDSDNSDDELVNVVRPPRSHVCGPRLTHLCRCLSRVHLHCLVQQLGQGRHHQEPSRDPAQVVNCSTPGLVGTPSRHSPRISPREYSGFWIFPTLQIALGCARNGVQVNLSIMVNILFLPWGFCCRRLGSMVSAVSQGEFQR